MFLGCLGCTRVRDDPPHRRACIRHVHLLPTPHAVPRRPPARDRQRLDLTRWPTQTTLSIARAAFDPARPGRRRPTCTWRPTDSARRSAAPPSPHAFLSLDRSSQCPGAARQTPEPTCPGCPVAPAVCPIAQRMTDSNHPPVCFRDQHLYAAYSTYLVGDTGSPHASQCRLRVPESTLSHPHCRHLPLARRCAMGRPETHRHRPAANAIVGSLSRTQPAVLQHCRRRGFPDPVQYLSAPAGHLCREGSVAGIQPRGAQGAQPCLPKGAGRTRQSPPPWRYRSRAVATTTASQPTYPG